MTVETTSLSKKDFMSDQMIRWCPGCGDYSILSQLQTVLADLGVRKEEVAIISGIGCSSRFPYYMNTYGFHTIHGRAPGVVTGLKAVRPELMVWMITGDGDGLSIGGNHLAHLLRRNVDVNVMLFNNRIYGLTKGQYSPTSSEGTRTKSSPMGSLDHPFNPALFALGSGATYVARSVDVFAAHLRDTLAAASRHAGTSFVEVFQNCNIFNDGAFEHFTARDVRDDRVLYAQAGAPLVWGKSVRKGLVQRGFGVEVVTLGEGHEEADCVVHDPTSLPLAMLLAELDPSRGEPVVLGTLYSVSRPTYEAELNAQLAEARAARPADLDAALRAGDTWTA